MASYGKDMLDKIQSNKNKDGNELLLEKTRGTLTGSAVGLFIGLYFAHSRNSSLLMGAFIGASIGGIITRLLISKK